MPTDLPPDYKPQPVTPNPKGGDSRDPGAKAPMPGNDSVDPNGNPQHGPGSGMPGPEGDVVDPMPGGGLGTPAPAGTPSF